jgi:hypothetical protein
MRVIVDHKDLLPIMECHFQRAISQTMQVRVTVQINTVNTGESKYESTCAYYYLYLFSGWWFNGVGCGYVSLNGKYTPWQENLGFLWENPFTGYMLPNRSEMKIRRQ